jgi:serine/threonine protein kinase/tetratricopeptide (TPR) repeat protein
MHVDRQNRIKDLLSDALELEPAARDSFLNSASGDDLTIRIEVRALIDAHERANEFLVDPTINHSPTGTAAGQMIGRYHVLNLIGEGGFGSVYRAQQREPVVREVALKVIKLGMDTRQVIARFEAERQALAIMDHPNIASVYDAGATETGRPFFVMEFVDGVSITEYCDSHRLPPTKRIRLFQDVCAAVQHAHTKGVIHRDLKPSNILVERHQGIEATDHGISMPGCLDASMPRPKIIDFGIAKAISGKLTDQTLTTELSRLIGTPEYMSPEQANTNADGGADIDTRSDIYSLGVLLYELLTGATPFDRARMRSSTFEELQRIIREEEAPKPSTRLSTISSLHDIAANRALDPRRLLSHVRGDLDWIVLKALEKDRDRRYGSAAELADDLRRHLNHQPVLASPPSVTYRVKKFVRRHRVGVLASCLIALAVMCGAVGLTVGMVQARNSAEEARDAAQQAQAVNDFMQEILTSVSPEADGADVRLVEVMDDASAAASQRFAGHPLLEAQARDLLGSVYADLSMWSKAKAEFKRATDLWQHHAGPEDPRAITSERLYVGSALNNQQIAEIESRLPSLLERTQRIFGPNDLATLDVQRAIGIVHMLRGRTDEAERILLDIRERLLAHGDDDALHIRTLRNLIRIGRSRSSGAEYRIRAALGAQIEPLAREQVERAVRAYGPASLIALEARIIWAEILADQRQYEAAADSCRAVLESASTRLADCHLLRMEAMDVLAEAAHRMGDSVAAADLELKRIACARQRGNAMAFIVTVSDALPILDRGERWVEGETFAREFIEKLNAMGGGHGDMVFDTEIWVARFVSLQGRLLEAEAMFQSLLARAEETDLAANVRARLHLFQGSNLCRRGAFEEAEAEIQIAADTVSDFRMGTRNTNPDDILVEFIALYNAWGKPEKADEYHALREQTLAHLPIDPS